MAVAQRKARERIKKGPPLYQRSRIEGGGATGCHLTRPLLVALVLVLTVFMLATSACGSRTDTGSPSSDTYSSTETEALDPGKGFISWDEAASHIGESVTIEGPVVGAMYADSSNGEPTFLNVGLDYPEPNRFTVVIWGDDRAAFPEAPESYYEGKTIRATGEVSTYEGATQMEVSSPDAIEVVD